MRVPNWYNILMDRYKNILNSIKHYAPTTALSSALIAGIVCGTLMRNEHLGHEIRDEISKAEERVQAQKVRMANVAVSNDPFELQMFQATELIKTLPRKSEQREKLIEYWYASGILNLNHGEPQSHALMVNLQSLRQTQDRVLALQDGVNQRSVAP